MRCVYQDDDVVVVDKPFGLRSVPAFRAADESDSHDTTEATLNTSHSENISTLRDEVSSNLPRSVNKRKRQERFSDVLGMLGAGIRTTSAPSSSTADDSAADLMRGVPANLGPHLVKLAAERDSVPRKRGNI